MTKPKTKKKNRTFLPYGLPDINDGKPWSEIDERDLKAELANGGSVEEAARHLCRAGTAEEVARKAEELGLTVRRCGPSLTGQRRALSLGSPRLPIEEGTG